MIASNYFIYLKAPFPALGGVFLLRGMRFSVFAELTGEISNKALSRGARVPGTGGHQISLGPTALGIYKNHAIEGGTQFSIIRDVGVSFEHEIFRYAINFSYFF